MTVTSLCAQLQILWQFRSTQLKAHSPPTPHPNPFTLQKKKREREKNQFHVSLEWVFPPQHLASLVLLGVFHANRRLDVWNNRDGTQHNVLHSLSKRKIVALNVQSGGSEFKCTGKAVGVILKAFKILSSLFPRPVLLFLFFFLAFSH